MGFQIARDTLANLAGERRDIRELCWKCAYRCSSEYEGSRPLVLESLL
jgi:hypothetical protein